MRKGVVLAGGAGLRLRPLTRVTNKHLLPVWDRPMIDYPVVTLRQIGVEDLLIVTGGDAATAGQFIRLLGDGRGHGLRRVEYAYQQGNGGIAAALLLAEEFAAGDPIAVALGDNILGGHLRASAAGYARQGGGARVVLARVERPGDFGVAEFTDDRLTRIVEKPPLPPSDWVVTGFYFYDAEVFDIIRTLTPSARGELEITDVNNVYIERGALEFDRLEDWWCDAGTFASLLEAGRLVRDRGANRLDRPGTVLGRAGDAA